MMATSRRVVARVIVVGSAMTIAFATLTPEASYASGRALCIICGAYGGVDAILNIGLFAPFGFGLAWMRVRVTYALVIVAGTTTLIEALQVFVIPGRDASVGDVIMNTLGGALGFLVGRYMHLLWRPHRRLAVVLAIGWALVWSAVQAGVAYSWTAQPFEPPYYGQLNRPGGYGRAPFSGRVVSARIDGDTIRSWQLPDPARVRTALAAAEGRPIQLTLAGGRPQHGLSEVMRVTGASGYDLTSFEQEGSALLFTVRSGANVLRLRPYLVRLDDVFLDARDTVKAEGVWARTMVTLTTNVGPVVRRQVHVPRLSDGWRLIMPVRTSIGAGRLDTLASIVFFGALLMPGAFWIASIGGDRRARIAAPVFFGTAVAAVLIVVPASFGLPALGVHEWATVIGAAALGALLERVAGTGALASILVP
jgi:hypothetical protein